MYLNIAEPTGTLETVRQHFCFVDRTIEDRGSGRTTELEFSDEIRTPDSHSVDLQDLIFIKYKMLPLMTQDVSTISEYLI